MKSNDGVIHGQIKGAILGSLDPPVDDSIGCQAMSDGANIRGAIVLGY